ncbi:MAG: hypothetical protein R3258_00400 [Acidimicrobiia bacterium]|nr:hypothetical protein [Acidimicrobiia bacterium]
MGNRGRESFQKRNREKARQEKQARKREARFSRESDGDEMTKAEEDALMQQFARLSARYQSGEVSHDDYSDERHRIFVELGLEAE